MGSIAFLLVRPSISTMSFGPGTLLAGYFLIATVAIAIPIADATSRRAAAPIHPTGVLAVGLVALAAVSLTITPVVPLRAGAWAPLFGLLAAVAEEALFRRLLYARLLRLGAPAAILASAALFALLHVPLYGTAVLPVDLGAGLLLSWQRWASGTWTVPAVTHAVANLLAVIR